MEVWFISIISLLCFNVVHLQELYCYLAPSYESTQPTGDLQCTTVYYETVPTCRNKFDRKTRSPEVEDDLKFRMIDAHNVSVSDGTYTILYGTSCSGAIIHKWWAITNAHCGFYGHVVYAGASLYSMTTEYTICAHYPHPTYQTKIEKNWVDFDIQLLLMERPFPDNITPLKLYYGDINDVGGSETAMVIGWGASSIDQKIIEKSERQLHKMYQPVWSDIDCQNHMKIMSPDWKSPVTTRYKICIGNSDETPYNKTGTTCFGDAGAPALASDQLIGIVAYGSECVTGQSPVFLVNLLDPDIREWMSTVTYLKL